MNNKTQNKSRPLTSFFKVNDVMILREEISRDSLIRKMLDKLGQNYDIKDPQQYFEAILTRENAADTVVGDGIALPHARVETLQRPYVCVATMSPGVVFAKRKPPVRLAFLVLIPKDTPDLYLQILKTLSAILRSDNAANIVAGLNTGEDVVKFFERGGFVLPNYVCAADIMDTHFESLRENDSLQTAIDNFITKNLSEIPVVDTEGDMVGIVCAKALLKVCLPEYLLWIEDLSPIINFQPFVHVMKNESNSWLADILVETFPSVQVSSPAISVAGEMTRRDTSTCYVLNGKKLVGTIDLPRFLNKIFRE